MLLRVEGGKEPRGKLKVTAEETLSADRRAQNALLKVMIEEANAQESFGRGAMVVFGQGDLSFFTEFGGCGGSTSGLLNSNGCLL